MQVKSLCDRFVGKRAGRPRGDACRLSCKG
jgi:hypothetical protein